MESEEPREHEPMGAGSRRAALHAIAAAIGLAAVLAIALWSGLRGIDFGHHWDEKKQIDNVTRTVRTGRLLPDWYNYPSVCYALTCLPLVPEVARQLATEEKPFSRVDFPRTQEELAALVSDPAYKLDARRVFLFLSACAPLWIFLGLVGRRGPLEALLAAALLATSFELAYHARWIAPDTVLTQFAALFLALSIRARSSRRPRRWLLAAAIAAGLATGTKYTAGLLLLPLCASAWLLDEDRSARERLRFSILLVCTWAATYLATTPGTLLEPVRFYQDLKFERRHYTLTGHYGHSVEPWLEHGTLAVRYLATVLLSPHAALALIFAGLALVGLAGLVREEPRAALVLFVLFPLAYFLYFASTRVLFVRNLLVLAPFLAIFAARGAALLTTRLPGRVARGLFAAALTAGVLLDATYLVHAARTIRPVDAARDVAAAERVERTEIAQACAAWLHRHPELSVRPSPEVAADLESIGAADLSNLQTATGEPVDALALYTGEGPTWGSWRSNRPGSLLAELGPLDVHYDWYTSWTQRRLLIVRVEVARDLGIELP